MKVILDTNIYVSYLLTRGRGQTIGSVVERCLADRGIELIVPPELLEELTTIVKDKSYLRENVTDQELDRLIASLQQLAEIPEPISGIVPLSRDPNDDFLLAHGLAEEVDYLVTGDDDLLSLEQVDQLAIVNAVQFLSKLR